jgi:hypothetical protein
VLINHKLYRFFAREKSITFAILVIPLHAIYYLYSVAAFACGAILHYWRNGRRAYFAPKTAQDHRRDGARSVPDGLGIGSD